MVRNTMGTATLAVNVLSQIPSSARESALHEGRVA